MQSTDQTKWTGIGKYKLALVALGAAVILVGVAALGPLGIDGDQTPSGSSITMTRDSIVDRNPRFLDFNVMPEAVNADVRLQPRIASLEHSRFLDMNLLPGDSASESGTPIEMGRPR
jgi:hypothetical protein